MGRHDNRISRDLVRQILDESEIFSHVEVRLHGRPSGLGAANIEAPHFRALRVADRQGVLDALFGESEVLHAVQRAGHAPATAPWHGGDG